jgi:hypothetical protein
VSFLDPLLDPLSDTGGYLTELLARVTGDPEALRCAAQTYEKYAESANDAAHDLYTLGYWETPKVWQGGWAADAFLLATIPVRKRITTATSPTLKLTATQLNRAADGLEQAQKDMAELHARFTSAKGIYQRMPLTVTLWWKVFWECQYWNALGRDVKDALATTLADVANQLQQATSNADAAAAAVPQVTQPDSANGAGTAAAEAARQALRSGSRDDLWDALAPLRSSTERIRTDHLNGKPPSADDLDFLQAFHQQLGTDTLGIAKLLDAAKNPDDQTNLKAVGDSIMMLSNQTDQDGRALTPDWVHTALAEPGIEEMEVPSHVPKSINIYYRPNPTTVQFGELVAASDLTPGHDLALDMAKNAGHMFEQLDKMNPTIVFAGPDSVGRTPVDTAQVQLVTSASRNHEAMADLFRDPVTMRNLLTGEWADDGATAAKTFAWLATPGQGQLAESAYLTLANTITGDDIFPTVAEAMMVTNPELSPVVARATAAHIDQYAQLTFYGDTGEPYPRDPAELDPKDPYKQRPLSLYDAEKMLMMGAFSSTGEAAQDMAATKYALDRLALAYRQYPTLAGLDEAGQKAAVVGFDRAGREAAAVAGAVAATENNAVSFENQFLARQHNTQLNKDFYARRQMWAGTGTGLAEASGVLTNVIRDGIFVANSPWGALATVPMKALNSYLQGAVRTPELEVPAPPPPNYNRPKMDVPNAGVQLAAYHVVLNRIAAGELPLDAATTYHPRGATPYRLEQAVALMKEDPRAESYINAFGPAAQNTYRTFANVRPAAAHYVQQMHKAD